MNLAKTLLTCMHNLLVAVLMLYLTPSTRASAQSMSPARQWSLEPQTFLAYYAASFGYDISPGVGLALGRELGRGARLLLGGTYHQTTQPLVLFGRAAKMQSAWTQIDCAAQKQWRLIRKPELALFAEAQAGLLFLRTEDLKLLGGAFGTITLRGANQTKFSPALGLGMRVRVWPRWAVLCYVKNRFLLWNTRRLEAVSASSGWKSSWQLGAGLGVFF